MSVAARYARAQKTATLRIGQYGKDAKLLRSTPPTSPSDPHRPNRGAETEIEIKLLETENSITKRRETIIQSGDLYGLISVADENPNQNTDSLLLGDDRYEFVELKPLAPGPQVILYEFHARR